MRIDKKHKIEKVVAKPKDRSPRLEHPYLRQNADGSWQLEATDSYKAIIVPIPASDVEENDQPGFLPIDALKRAAKNGGHVMAGEQVSAGGMTESRPDPGDPVDLARIVETNPHAQDAAYAEMVIGINAKLLYELAQGLGDDVVELRISSPLKPIGVAPTRIRQGEDPAIGVLMPVRLTHNLPKPA